MKKSGPIAVLLVLAVCTCVSFVRAQNSNFRGLPWGATREDVVKAEGGRTIDPSTIFPEGSPLSMLLRDPGLESLAYAGRLNDLDCVYAFFFAGGKMVQGRYVFSEKHSDANLHIEDFQKVKSSLTDRYGKPEQDVALWRDERYKSDRTQWGKALTEGHFGYTAVWRLPDTCIMHQLAGVNSALLHGLQYESTNKELLDLARAAREKARSEIR